MDKLRFGICGLGFMGRSHFHRLRGHPRAEVVAVCDQDGARRQGQWDDELGNLDVGGGPVSMEGVRAYAAPLELVADPQIDVVLIALPTRMHAEVALAALEAGKHVLTEKPMAYRVGECDRMIRAAEARGRTLMVAQCIRFWPQYELIRQQLHEGAIGKLRCASLRRVGAAPTWSAGGWLIDGAQSGGALLDLHVHDVDFVNYLLGVPDTITAHGLVGASGEIDHVFASWGYADGRCAVMEGGWLAAPSYPFDMSIIIHGERGTLEWSLARGSDVLLFAGDGEPVHISATGDALRNELDYFIDCVRDGCPVERCAPRSTRVSLGLVWLERRSIELRRQVEISARLRRAWGVA